jgi:hypothetical protein
MSFPTLELLRDIRNVQGPLRRAVFNGCVPLVQHLLYFLVEFKFRIIQGRGIIHAEMPVHGKGVPEPRGLQLWVDLPKEVRSLIIAARCVAA